MTSARPIDPETRIGHVHLKVADLERALGFFRDVLGFEVTQAVFLSAGGYHHHIGLNTWESLGGSLPPERPVVRSPYLWLLAVGRYLPGGRQGLAARRYIFLATVLQSPINPRRLRCRSRGAEEHRLNRLLRDSDGTTRW
jgi:hypothetical protein